MAALANITDLTSEGDVSLSGTISTIGNQTYNANASLRGNTTLQAGYTDSVILTTVDSTTGAESLNVNAGSEIHITGNVGLGTALAAINLSSGDSTNLQGTIRTVDGQQSFGEKVNLTDSLTLESGTGDINFGNGIGFVSGPVAGLTIDSTGTTTLADTVNVLSIATDAGGVTRLGSAVTTSGNTQGLQ